MTDPTALPRPGAGSSAEPDAAPATGDKATLRTEMRRRRRALADRDNRSVQLWEHVRALPAMASARRLMVFSTIVGEPEIEPLVEWCRARGIETAVPEHDVDAAWPDVVVVPGLAFTPGGARLGQGGGWYDRFLANVDRSRCVVVGVCFAEQLVESLPTEPHDVAVDHVVTEEGVVTDSERDSQP
jgi:5-formyltetrahydrofolate cyclo-ligase